MIETEKIQHRLSALEALEKGIKGAPLMVDHEEGSFIMQEARQLGMQLFILGQITQQGYKLKPNCLPILRKYFPAPHNKHLDLYDLNSQCEKADIVK